MSTLSEITVEQFVRVWMQQVKKGGTIFDVAKELNRTTYATNVRAQNFLKKGINLPKLPLGGIKVDTNKINKLISLFKV